MKNWIWMMTLATAVILGGAMTSQAQQAPVAGVIPLGVTVEELKVVTVGWSAKKHILDRSVYNDNKEKVGEIEDIIITPSNYAAFAILGVGGFLGLGERRVAIPMKQLKYNAADKTFLLPGATKDSLKGMPPFVYAE